MTPPSGSRLRLYQTSRLSDCQAFRRLTSKNQPTIEVHVSGAIGGASLGPQNSAATMPSPNGRVARLDPRVCVSPSLLLLLLPPARRCRLARDLAPALRREFRGAGVTAHQAALARALLSFDRRHRGGSELCQ